MMTVVNVGFLIATILLIWFKSDAFYHYVKLFGLDRLFFIEKYDKQKEDDPLLTYPQFIKMNFGGIISKILTCPLCFTIWISTILAITFNMIVWWPTIVIVSLGTYYTLILITKWT